MLFSAFLLIAWVAIAPSSVSSSKRIPLQIPTKVSSSHVTKNIPEINPLIFSSLKESMIISPNRSRHFSKVSDFRKVSKNSRYPANPSTGNVDLKVLLGEGIRNLPFGFRSYRGGRDVSNTTNMNNPSRDNGSKGNKITHLSHSRDFGDQHLKQAEKGDGNRKLLNDDDYHYSTSPRENVFHENDRVSHLFDTDFHESQIRHKTSEENITEKETRALLETTTSFHVLFESGKTFPAAKEFSSLSSVTPGHNGSDIQNKFQTRDQINENMNGTALTNETGKHELNQMSSKNKTYGENVNESVKTSLRKEHENYLKNDTPVRTNELVNKTNVFSGDILLDAPKQGIQEKITLTNELPTMQQDGAFEPFAQVTEISSYISDNYYSGEKSHKGQQDAKKTDSIGKIPPIMTSPSFFVTTPVFHMNDPPFRGPHVPRENDRFDEEEKDSKIEFWNPNSVMETPFYKSKAIGREWANAKILGKAAWDYHCYVIGSIFAIIALYSFISLLRVKAFTTLLQTGYYITINLLLFIVCTSRAFYLFYDPYNFTKKLPLVASQILLKITLPSLNTAFCFLILALLSFTKTQIFSLTFQNPYALAIITLLIISIIISIEIAVHVFHITSILLLMSYLVIITFGLISSISYFLVFGKLRHRAWRKQVEMNRVSFTKMHIDGAQLPEKLPRPTLGLAVKLVLATTVYQILLCGMLPYAVLFLKELFPKVGMPNPWIWFGYQLTCRILELLMCGTMSFIATQPLRNYEIEENMFHKLFACFSCCHFSRYYPNEETIDFEAHSDNYANPQGIRNPELNLISNTRRLQTNSLPTFRTPLNGGSNDIPMRTLPYSGRNTNHASALSLLSYYRSKRTLSTSKTGDFEDLENTLGNQSIFSGGKNAIRPASMLYKDNGFIRFRRETDPEQPMEMSDEDDLAPEEIVTCLEDADSVKANIVGSSYQSLLESDIFQNTLSPFFQLHYKKRFRKMSRVSIETTDYSADVSSDQLSNIVNLRGGLSTSALDFHTKKQGSTCSSESAANSFDVTFFLNSNSSPDMQTSPFSTTPASLNICSAYRSETEDDKTSSVEGHEEMLRSVSPIVKQASFGRLSLNLNLHASSDTSHSNGLVNVACGTEDITPDSAVYLDLHLPRENINTTAPGISQQFLNTQNSPQRFFSKFSDEVLPLNPDRNSVSPYRSPTSQSLGEIRTSHSYVVPPFRKNSRGLLYKLRGSTFSLNTAAYGYELLEHEEPDRILKYQKNWRKLERSSSDRRPLSDGHLDMKFSSLYLTESRNMASSGSDHLGDSGLLGDCGVALVDVASQTEDCSETNYIHKSHSVNTNAHCCLTTEL